MNQVVKKQENSKRVLKKHVSAIHAVADLSALQRKLVNALLLHAYDGLLTQKNHVISIGLLCEMIGFESKNVSHLKKALVGIMETVMEFDVMDDDGESAWEAMSLLTYVKIKNGECTYRYEQSLAEKLHHPEIYSKINLNVLRNMRSSHALVLYENCLRYVAIGHTPVWDLDLFRKLMAVQDRYKEFKFLKRDVIVPAMKEINSISNIQVEMRTVQSGRSVTALQFLVKYNPQMALLDMEEEDEISSSEAYKSLLEQGISKTLARSWVVEYGEEHVLDKIDLTKSKASQGKITSSKSGFLKAAIIEDYHNEDAVKKKLQRENEDTRLFRRRTEAQIEGLRNDLRAAEKAYRKFCTEIQLEAFNDLPDGEKDAVSAEFQLGLTSRIYVDAFKQGGWADRRIYPDAKVFWEARGVVVPSPTEWADRHSTETPDQIRTKIEKLEILLDK